MTYRNLLYSFKLEEPPTRPLSKIIARAQYMAESKIKHNSHWEDTELILSDKQDSNTDMHTYKFELYGAAVKYNDYLPGLDPDDADSETVANVLKGKPIW